MWQGCNDFDCDEPVMSQVEAKQNWKVATYLSGGKVMAFSLGFPSCCFFVLSSVSYNHYLDLPYKQVDTLVEQHVLAVFTIMYSCQNIAKIRKEKSTYFNGRCSLFFYLHVAITSWCYKQNALLLFCMLYEAGYRLLASPALPLCNSPPRQEPYFYFLHNLVICE